MKLHARVPEHRTHPTADVAEARRQLAALRAARGADAPTLGWLFGDTPGVPSPDDGAMAVAPVDVEQWAAGAGA